MPLCETQSEFARTRRNGLRRFLLATLGIARAYDALRSRDHGLSRFANHLPSSSLPYRKRSMLPPTLALPEFDGVGDDTVAAPVFGERNAVGFSVVRILNLEFADAFREPFTLWNFFALQ